ncbi:MAG: S-adenosyl-l-methionine hydroxide adenosyltransferase family protein [Candidatus Thermoplasmatota archaeon]|nr:S-adenosyl-l-methionine hydroxide adenosyltransferase family protein [Candidatus Thermoplasmatota archaeon]
MNVITFLSDFGMKSGYVSQMKGVANTIMPQVRCIDITHEIPCHDIHAGAFVLMNAAAYFPTGTVHVAVVDPGVGTKRRGIVVLTQTQIFVGPDNGLLIPAARSLGTFRVYEITNHHYQGKSVSHTFHGRDIFAPVAAHILRGISFDSIGSQIHDFVDFRFPLSVRNTDDTIDAQVLFVDDFGNIITNIEQDTMGDLFASGRDITIYIGKQKRSLKFVDTYGSLNPGVLLCTFGSSGLLEISINQGNAAESLHVTRDDDLKIAVVYRALNDTDKDLDVS